MNEVIARLLADPTCVEAVEWLTTDDGEIRTLGEASTPEKSLKFVRRIYRAGAQKVLVSDIRRRTKEYVDGPDEHRANSGKLVIELPPVGAKRKRLFALEAAQARRLGFDPQPDLGETHLLLMLD